MQLCLPLQDDDIFKGFGTVLQALAGPFAAIKQAHSGNEAIAALPERLVKWSSDMCSIVHNLMSYKPSEAELDKAATSWYAMTCTEFGGTQPAAHGLECLEYGKLGIYDHWIGEHMLDDLRELGPLILYASWGLESNHKYAKRQLVDNCSRREPAAHETIFCEPHVQSQRALNQMNFFARAEVLGKIALMLNPDRDEDPTT
jgi:hypothetical protein